VIPRAMLPEGFAIIKIICLTLEKQLRLCRRTVR
jgi:hypothetical protein